MKSTKKYIKEIASKLEKITGFKTTVYPPMGLRATIGLALKDDDNNLKGYLTITEENNKVFYDTEKVLEKYPTGSIGELNGFGRETKELPTDINLILELMKIKNN